MVTTSTETSSRQAFLDRIESNDPKADDFAVQCVDALLQFVIPSGASDVHLNPNPDGWEVQLRVDGVLTSLTTIRRGGSSDPVSRLMVMAGLPSYRSGQPMEGRVRLDRELAETDSVSVRLGIFPTVHGPRAVIRILHGQETLTAMEDLGLDEQTTRSLIELSEQTDGAVLLSGPAGSGKTTTLYAMLRRIASQRPRRSILTIEDPVESVIAGINQSEIDVASGMTIAASLRSAVRQDSEVLLVSEIRDPETAEAAVQASLTGHLVFSSLHATDVSATLRRLVSYGIPLHAIESGLRAVINQRLLRKRCGECENHAQPSDCDRCLGTGYRDRVAIAQVVRFDGTDPVGNSYFESMSNGVSASDMIAWATEAGWMPLKEQAALLCDRGVTDQAEIFRVFGRSPV